MPNEITQTQRAFLESFVIKGSAAETAPDQVPNAAFQNAWKPAYAAWQSTSDAIDTQVAALQNVLKNLDDPVLKEIGDLGLNAITGNHRVKMLAALRDIDSAKPLPNKAMITKAAVAIKNLEAHFSSDPRIAACDNNPFGVSMSIVKSTSGALGQIKAALRVGLAGAA